MAATSTAAHRCACQEMAATSSSDFSLLLLLPRDTLLSILAAQLGPRGVGAVGSTWCETPGVSG